MKMYICGIHTDAGKTHLCVALCKAFNYSYFKIVQAGCNKDSDILKRFVKNVKVHKEGIFLNTPASPHIAKKLDNIEYSINDLILPIDDKMIIELAGGLFCPIDDNLTMIDFMKKHKRKVILAARNYLGMINHTILSIKALQDNGFDIVCVVMIGEIDTRLDEFIYNYTGVNIAHLEYFDEFNIDEKIQEFKNEIEKYLRS
ncbi:dethiobiotin synthase [Campylobacter sp. RM12637]|nr:dethiobiotin synthase [Campylobacter sp. 2018MI13]MBZ7976167.1 dethiobiotin synthase [Campylobacter sp. RM12637]